MTTINEHLQQLIALHLTRTTRAANMECFKFGHLLNADKGSNQIDIGEFGLHLQCPWRLTNENQILVADSDLYEQPDENAGYDEDFEWDKTMANLRDIKLDRILKTEKLIVSTVVSDNFGGFEIIFNDNIKLTVFPNRSSKAYGNEFWRLLDNRPTSKSHFVVTTNGIEKDDEE